MLTRVIGGCAPTRASALLLEVLRGDGADAGEELRPTGVSLVQIG